MLGRLLLRWPLPALLTWAAAWGLFVALRLAGVSALLALGLSVLAGAALALVHEARWRRLIVAAGFPASLLMTELPASLPAWIWLLPLVGLAFVYPRRTWGDAPLFPTPAGALRQLGELAPLNPLKAAARVLDAGCGLGHGLRELRRAYPQARLEGIEWSRPLAALARWRCPWALVTRGDMWAPSWGAYDLVYVFQRPESMAHVWAKACRDMRPGAWLVSLDFEVPGEEPVATLPLARGHSLWIYQPGVGVGSGRLGTEKIQAPPVPADMG